MRCTFTDEGRARRRRWFDALMSDPLVAASGLAPLAGPEAMPPEGFTDQAYEHLLAL